jgi:hypothetical protein
MYVKTKSRGKQAFAPLDEIIVWLHQKNYVKICKLISTPFWVVKVGFVDPSKLFL